MKHALLIALIRGLQRKDKGLLLLDTHAGRGEYELGTATRGDTLPRKAEHPDGVGRLAGNDPELADYCRLVREFSPDGSRYPGSPRILERLARPQDRVALCELHPEEAAQLRAALGGRRRVLVQALDGYVAVRAMLPPPERRALVLIDPPYEAENEWHRVGEALQEGLRRFPSGTYAVWHPLTERAGGDRLAGAFAGRDGPPAWAGALEVAPGAPGMRGCGLIVVNPPWEFAETAGAILGVLARVLGRDGPGVWTSRWLRPET